VAELCLEGRVRETLCKKMQQVAWCDTLCDPMQGPQLTPFVEFEQHQQIPVPPNRSPDQCFFT
jgi:hypothetical protein